MKTDLPHLLKPLQRDQASHRLAVVLTIPDASPRLNECLMALSAASNKARAQSHQVDIFVVIDGRNSESAAIVSTFPVHLVTADFSDPGQARAIGARAAWQQAPPGWRLPRALHWWLTAGCWNRSASGTDLMLGSVEITNGFMPSELDQGGSGWQQMSAAQRATPNFSNLGMSRSAFELACQLGGRELCLDAELLDQLTRLELAIHRCSKPLVYARMQELKDIFTSAALQAEAPRSSLTCSVAMVPLNALVNVTRALLPVATVAGSLAKCNGWRGCSGQPWRPPLSPPI